MNNDPTYNRLRELSWRRALTHAEEAELQGWLAAHPEARAEWDAESGLNAALGRLPDAPVPSNFTARVLQAVERDTVRESRAGRPKWRRVWYWRWLPRTAFAAALAGAGLLSYQHVQTVDRKRLVESVAVVSAVSSMPSPEILKDFETIQAMTPAPAPDEELLAALQ